MNLKGLVLFDIDGVIRDVANSYRLAVQETVKKFCGWKPSPKEIDSLKAEGCWNNDWDASLELIKRHCQLKRLSLKVPSRKIVINEFSNFYFGGNPHDEPEKWKGFIKNEPLIVNKEFFDQLTEQRILWGFISGAEIPSAKYVLESRIGLINPPLLAMGEAPDKPDPTGLIKLSSKLLSQPLGKSIPPIAYLGDTVADVHTIRNARKQFPDQKFISMAVAPPHLQTKEKLLDRKNYESQLRDAGADEILESTNNIFEHICTW
ncbi:MULTISPECIES: TIGR01548 family HAD-type hydrolase [Prochlorococcus]|uniref:Predicted HAD superfamily phosphatase n=1 Tax=Prochlorococcus marinus (strain SARG / CCMP1375 / SS120) TaxID=167539 RepID=Q7VA73_PROMA|nr:MULTISPECIES: TIGR01548 family HAD-type hydrolase [Prochlorococcus]AAQ00638.1 Predicted HAD superfamily phosphatase [Prochlorococcus marinus subsp. marinus str. CCMP1375]KGG10867.1 hypothetical protein EV04_1829 [Prochlorococcus marinus str. LG]KGG20447.1 hypothetical protein EV08_1031 [Prochlorococcus marinus str. SS2]KGG24116.1 hypothetical protein EV09_0721 [Prochlorococcus marinus str. SS35]KGG31627.1 hypothetical protein EV10_1722 [Prochlorococcus marinus str. SS51]